MTELALRTPTGEPLPLRADTVRRDGDGIVLVTTLEPAAFVRVLAESLFHTDPLDLSATPPGLDDARPVTVELRLDDTVAAGVAAGDVPDLSAEPVGSALLDSESWHVADVSQPVLSSTGGATAPGTSLRTGSRGPVRLIDMVVDFLAGAGMQPEQVGPTELTLDGDGTNGSWTLRIHTLEDDGWCLVASEWPEMVPDERMAEVTELVLRANAMLPVGGLSLDLETGSFALRTGIDVSQDRLSHGLLSALVADNTATFDQLIPALRAVLEGDSALAALAGHLTRG